MFWKLIYLTQIPLHDKPFKDVTEDGRKTKTACTWDPIQKMADMKFQIGLSFASVYMKKSYRDSRKILVCNSLVKLC